MQNFLTEIHWDPFGGISGIYVTEHHIKGFRYFSSYKNGVLQKQVIFDKLAAGGMKENKGDWDWHHVVEGNHLEPLFSSSDYNRKYNSEWPTVLMHSREEHEILNSLFRLKETLRGLRKTGNTPLEGVERRTYLATLYNRYQDIYSGDRILQKVAHNVIKSIR